MKKLVSIGVAVALLAMVVLPVGVAAYTPPDTFADTPFAIVQSGFELVGNIIRALEPAGLGIPVWAADVTDAIGPWTGGPLSWTVDMLGWGLDLVADILAVLPAGMGVPEWSIAIVRTVSCALFTPFADIIAPPFAPCP